MLETLAGTIERVAFHNPENGFVVLRVNVKGQRGPVTVVGQTPRAVGGGVSSTRPERGRTTPNMASSSRRTRSRPAAELREGIEKYLGSGLIKGIGPHYARKIVDVFGERTLQSSTKAPRFSRRSRASGRAASSKSARAGSSRRPSATSWSSCNRTAWAQAMRVASTRPTATAPSISSGRIPYRLADDVWGIGFQTADRLALKLGYRSAVAARAQAILRHVLQEASSDGHCGCPEELAWKRSGETQTGMRRDRSCKTTAGTARPARRGEFGAKPSTRRRRGCTCAGCTMRKRRRPGACAS